MAKQEQANTLQQLKADIKAKTPGRLYVFFGEETFLLDHYVRQLKKILLDELTESFNYHRLTNETFDLQTFADAVENLPMMAEATLVQVDDVDPFKLPESERNKMAEILSDIPDYCTVVFTYLTVAWKPDKRYAKLWDAVDQHGCIVEFAVQEQRDLIPWISRHFAAHQKRITNDLCAYLIEITGGTMTALSSEITKICAYSGAEQIRKTDIDAVTEPVLDAVIYEMTNLLAQGRYMQALHKLQQLLKMQEEPVMILGALGGHFRRIATARTLLDYGSNIAELRKLTGISEYPAKKAMEAARDFSGEYCAKAMTLILETDIRMKTSFDTPQRLLEMLILQLAKEARGD